MKKTILLIFAFAHCFIVTNSISGQTLRKEKYLLNSLKAELLKIHNTDQKHRLLSDSIFRKNPNEESALQQSFSDSIAYYDSINIIKITDIISKYGWLPEKEVGYKANMTILLVIQHASFKTQKRLLPEVEKALKEDKLKPSHYALFKDRTLLREGKKQVYGSQISYDNEAEEYFVAPLQDPDHVDERRKSMGLGPLADYVKQWGITWNISEYKKKVYPNLFAETQ